MSHESAGNDLGPISDLKGERYLHLFFTQFVQNDLMTGNVFSSGRFLAVNARHYQNVLTLLQMNPSGDLRDNIAKASKGDLQEVGGINIMRKGWIYHSPLELPSRTGISINLNQPGMTLWDRILPEGTEESNYILSHLLESFSGAVVEFGRLVYEEYKKGNSLPFAEVREGELDLTSIPVCIRIVSGCVIAHDLVNIIFSPGYNVEVEETKATRDSTELQFTIKL